MYETETTVRHSETSFIKDSSIAAESFVGCGFLEVSQAAQKAHWVQ